MEESLCLENEENENDMELNEKTYTYIDNNGNTRDIYQNQT